MLATRVTSPQIDHDCHTNAPRLHSPRDLFEFVTVSFLSELDPIFPLNLCFFFIFFFFMTFFIFSQNQKKLKIKQTRIKKHNCF